MKTGNIKLTDDQKNVLYNIALIQYKNISRLKIYNGHDVFKLEIDTGIVSKAIYDSNIDTNFNLKYEIGHIYIPALRLATAMDKFVRIVKYANYIIAENSLNDAKKDASLSLKGDEQIITNNIENNP